jgi:catechol 2,3-dioxygenase-like lactoylglutathione lyase family enzyme
VAATPEMHFEAVTLAAPASGLASLDGFYRGALALAGADREAGVLELVIGESRLCFVPGPAAAFYHVALLVPGDRFGPAHAWMAGHAELLPDGSGSTVFEFPGWQAQACYFHDPAGNIIELIAHRGIGEHGHTGPFAAGELIGLSEVGLVGDPAAMAAALERGLGLPLWDGDVTAPPRLGFVGARARTFVLAPVGRGWVPTGRGAEPHPVSAVLGGTRSRAVGLEAGRHRIRGSA